MRGGATGGAEGPGGDVERHAQPVSSSAGSSGVSLDDLSAGMVGLLGLGNVGCALGLDGSGVLAGGRGSSGQRGALGGDGGGLAGVVALGQRQAVADDGAPGQDRHEGQGQQLARDDRQSGAQGDHTAPT